jgi:hypothetical protein
MSMSLFCHGFGIVGYHYIRTEYREGDIIFTVSKKNSVFAAQFVKAKGS